MFSNQYVEQVDRMMDQMSFYINISLVILSIVLAVAGYFQWRINKSDVDKLREEIKNDFNMKVNKIDKEYNTKTNKIDKEFNTRTNEIENKLSSKIRKIDIEHRGKILEINKEFKAGLMSGVNANGGYFRINKNNLIIFSNYKSQIKAGSKEIEETVSLPHSLFDSEKTQINIFVEIVDEKGNILRVMKRKIIDSRIFITFEPLDTSSEVQIDILVFNRLVL